MIKWKNIETAPKDGIEIILWTPEGVDIGRYEKAEKKEDSCYSIDHDEGWISLGCRSTLWGTSNREPQNQPTHWIPLPKPPEDIEND